MYKELLSFSSWNLYATLSWMIKGQGINMLLNIFFGPTINAARGIAFQVNSAVKSFTTNFSTAFNPKLQNYMLLNNILNYINSLFNVPKYLFF